MLKSSSSWCVWAAGAKCMTPEPVYDMIQQHVEQLRRVICSESCIQTQNSTEPLHDVSKHVCGSSQFSVMLIPFSGSK